jgi:Ala-tRNA(Pro) deacylase
MTCKDRLESYFALEGVPCSMQHHSVAFTAQEVAESEHIPGKTVVKSVVVWSDGVPTILALPASYLVDFALVQKALGAEHVRLATESELAQLFADCEVGAVPPFGNLYDIPVYVDTSLTSDETIVFAAGTHTETARVKYADFARLVEPVVVEIAQPRATLAP